MKNEVKNDCILTLHKPYSPAACSEIEEKIVFFPGRFNFFHKGHASALKQIFNLKPKKIYVGLGRCNIFRSPENPCDEVERRNMIINFCNKEGLNTSILEIFPIFNLLEGELKWTKQEINDWYKLAEESIKNQNFDNFNLIVIGNSYALSKSKINDIPCVDFTEIIKEVELFDSSGLRISGTNIRNRVLLDQIYKDFLPQSTLEILDSLGGAKKILLECEKNKEKPLDSKANNIYAEAIIKTVNELSLNLPPKIRLQIPNGVFKDYYLIEKLFKSHLPEASLSKNWKSGLNSFPQKIFFTLNSTEYIGSLNRSKTNLISIDGENILETKYDFKISKL